MKNIPKLVTDTATLKQALAAVSSSDFVAIDTEFMRETTYYPQLCLIQVCANEVSFCIDPMSEGIDLTPFFELLSDRSVVKVFHAGRQDLEIFVHLTGNVPAPVYDTQIAAMVCGLGDQTGYDRLVYSFTRKTLDKSSRFTNWAQRPLSDRQINYALDDVIYLAQIYPKIVSKLSESGRDSWVDTEMAQLSEKQLYINDPNTVWKKMKPRGSRPDMLNRLIHLAAWREQEAQNRNQPRGRILRDDTVMDLAGSNPQSLPEFKKIRGFPGGEGGKLAGPVLAVLQQAAQTPQSEWPNLTRAAREEKAPPDILELLRVLLKHVSEDEQVAPRLIATAEELEKLARSATADIRAQSGWRHGIFGASAIKLMSGKLALSVSGNAIKIIELK
jgi:ribonuclease D